MARLIEHYTFPCGLKYSIDARSLTLSVHYDAKKLMDMLRCPLHGKKCKGNR